MKKKRSLDSAWGRFLTNKPALLGFYFIIFMLMVAVFGALLRPDKTVDANTQILGAAKLRPFSTISALQVKSNIDVVHTPFFKKLLFGGQQDIYKLVPFSSYEFDGIHMILTGLDPSGPSRSKILLPDILYSLTDAEIERLSNTVHSDGVVKFSTRDGQNISTTVENLQKSVSSQIISKTFWLGTDSYGRDMLSRLMAGSLVSLSVGAIAVLISLLFGLTLGSIAGYFGGKLDKVIQWAMNVIWSIPGILLVIAISFVLGKGLGAIYIAIGAILWVELARVVRGLVFSIREREFVKAAQLMQFSDFRIIFRHIYPNVTGPVVVICASNFASAIMMEAGLSFLGIGVQPPTPSWGNMIREHYGFIITDGAYLAVVPGLALILLILSFILVGNGLREATDFHIQPSQSGRNS